ncbi:MAG TPA: hypothetical protein EYN66_08180 [Myxococcales bacterium]|nr:hypothetical protein [Myxococcales bacterium]
MQVGDLVKLKHCVSDMHGLIGIVGTIPEQTILAQMDPDLRIYVVWTSKGAWHMCRRQLEMINESR